MKQVLGIIGVIAVIVRLSGLDLSIVQTIAWVQMINERSTEMSFQDALEDTFTGKKPCSLCQQVQKEREKRNESELLNDQFKEQKFCSKDIRTVSALSFPKESHLAYFHSVPLPRHLAIEVILPPPEQVS